jgi:hypothetical protein
MNTQFSIAELYEIRTSLESRIMHVETYISESRKVGSDNVDSKYWNSYRDNASFAKTALDKVNQAIHCQQ